MLADTVLDWSRDALNDASDVTWALDEKLRQLNLGQLWIADLKADALAKVEAVALVAGVRQSLPSARVNGALTPSLRFLRLVRNMGADGLTPGPTILPADLEVMDRMRPGWHQDTAYRTVRHYLYDPRRKAEYYVWPPVPSSPAVYVELEHVPAPADVPYSTSKPRYVAEHHAIGIPADFGFALAEFIAWRCYAKEDDLESKANAEAHRQGFYQAIGIKADQDTAQHPAERVPYRRSEGREPALRA